MNNPMDNKLNCVLLIDSDEKSIFYDTVVLKNSNYFTNIKSERNITAAINYIINSGHFANRDQLSPFPDLILLDVYLPVLDGWDFLNLYENIKKMLPKEPVIILQSYSIDASTKLRASSRADIKGVYDKPLTPETVSLIIAQHFHGLRKFQKNQSY